MACHDTAVPWATPSIPAQLALPSRRHAVLCRAQRARSQGQGCLRQQAAEHPRQVLQPVQQEHQLGRQPQAAAARALRRAWPRAQQQQGRHDAAAAAPTAHARRAQRHAPHRDALADAQRAHVAQALEERGPPAPQGRLEEPLQGRQARLLRLARRVLRTQAQDQAQAPQAREHNPRRRRPRDAVHAPYDPDMVQALSGVAFWTRHTRNVSPPTHPSRLLRPRPRPLLRPRHTLGLRLVPHRRAAATAPGTHPADVRDVLGAARAAQDRLRRHPLRRPQHGLVLRAVRHHEPRRGPERPQRRAAQRQVPPAPRAQGPRGAPRGTRDVRRDRRRVRGGLRGLGRVLRARRVLGPRERGAQVLRRVRVRPEARAEHLAHARAPHLLWKSWFGRELAGRALARRRRPRAPRRHRRVAARARRHARRRVHAPRRPGPHGRRRARRRAEQGCGRRRAAAPARARCARGRRAERREPAGARALRLGYAAGGRDVGVPAYRDGGVCRLLARAAVSRGRRGDDDMITRT